jgi:putative endonuclease
LVFYEKYERIGQAITREKQLKNWKRKWKEELIKKQNPAWNDLSEEIGITAEFIRDVVEYHRYFQNENKAQD